MAGVEYFHMTDFWEQPRAIRRMDRRQKKGLAYIGCCRSSTTILSGASAALYGGSHLIRFDSILSSVVKQLCGDIYGVAALDCWRQRGHPGSPRKR